MNINYDFIEIVILIIIATVNRYRISLKSCHKRFLGNMKSLFALDGIKKKSKKKKDFLRSDSDCKGIWVNYMNKNFWSKLRIRLCCVKLFFLIFEFSCFQLTSFSLVHITIYMLFLAKYSLVDKFMLFEKNKMYFL